MFFAVRIRKKAAAGIAAALLLVLAALPSLGRVWAAEKDFIKWVDFDAPYVALRRALEADVRAHEEGSPVDWVDLLAYLAAKYGGDFSLYKESDLERALERLSGRESLE